MLEKALTTYKKSSETNTWDQEIFLAKYQIAILSEQLEYPFEEVVKNYSDTFSYRQSRAEPLMRLATYLRSKGHDQLAYLIANHGLAIPLPEDLLFIETWAYEWGLKFEKALCSLTLGNYSEALQLSIELFEENKLPEAEKKWTDGNIACALVGLKKDLAKKEPVK